MIKKYLQFAELIKESEEISVSGKGIFSSFLKSLTALGQKDSSPSWDQCPNNFLLYYHYPNMDAESVRQVFSRFTSLTRYLNYIDSGKNEVDLYFGIKCDGQFEYGIKYEEITPLGRFKLSLSTIRWMLKIDSKSASSLKKEIVNLNYNDILTLGLIKTNMNEFNPGYHEKKGSIILNDKILTFSYYGAGNWNSGKLDDGEFNRIKTDFHNWVLTKKWGSKVLISVKPESFWVYINIKLK